MRFETLNSFAGATIVTILLIWLLLNFATFVVYAWDKYSARRKIWRVPERQMLGMVLIGGSLGALLAMHFLRHKTRKEPFRTYLKYIIILQVVVGIALCFPQVRGSLVTYLALR